MNKENKQKSGGRAHIYEDAFKIAVAREYLDGELGYFKLAQKHKLPEASTVRHFVKWYRTTYPQPASAVATQKEAQPDQAVATAKEAALYKELEDARLKIAALETMISIARTELGIDILKKAGAKQSKP